MAATTSGLNLKTFQTKLASLTTGGPSAASPLGFFSTATTTTPSTAYAPSGAKAAAFPIVGILLVVAIIVLYSTGRGSTESIISLAGLTLVCLFGGLLYAFMPAGGFKTASGFNWKGFGLMFSAAVLSMLVILLIVHYTIRPVFKVKEAGPGMIPVPTVSKDSTGLYWTKMAGSLASADTVLGASDEGTHNYSLTVDMLIKDPNVTALSDRPIFSRSDAAFKPASVAAEGVSIVQQIGNYNLSMYLDRATNDLIVSTMSTGPDNVFFENVIIENIPVQKPFRIGVVMGNKFMEVYFNGKLHSTRQLAGVPLPVTGAFIPPAGNFTVMADVRNLRIWRGAITPAEMAYLPAINVADFGSLTDRSLSPLSEIADRAAGLCPAVAGVGSGIIADAQANMGNLASLLNNGATSTTASSNRGSASATEVVTGALVSAIGGSASSAAASAAAIGGSASSAPATAAPATTPAVIGSSSSAATAPAATPINITLPSNIGSSSSSFSPIPFLE